MRSLALLLALCLAVLAPASPASSPTPSPAPASITASPFLADWMGSTMDAIGSLPLSSLSLAGTHDTMTYDLSRTISDGGIDDEAWLAKLLHDIPGFVNMVGASDFIRLQAQTQGLNVTAQLDAGLRFLDFRIMYTSKDWYCLHMLQSNHPALYYLQQVRAWLDAHPSEVIVMWLTKHGSGGATGDAQYPNVTTAEKRAFWAQIETTFAGLLLNTSESSANATPLAELVKRKHRVAIYAGDRALFTGNSTLAADGGALDNDLEPDVGSNGAGVADKVNTFKNAGPRLANDAKANHLWLMSTATSPPGSIIEDVAELKFLPTVDIMDTRRKCAADMKIPNMTLWCPRTLIDVSQLNNYYNQLALEVAYRSGYDFPNLFYVDAVTSEGGLRTGTERLSQAPGTPACAVYKYTSCQTHQPTCDDAGFTRASGAKAHFNIYDSDGTQHTLCGLPWQNHYQCCRDAGTHDTSSYAYVDTIVASNVRHACHNTSAAVLAAALADPAVADPPAACAPLLAMLEGRRAAQPITQWDDEMTGRHSAWPAVPLPPAYHK